MDLKLYNAAINGPNNNNNNIIIADRGRGSINLNELSSQNNTVLHNAAKSGHKAIAEQVLTSNPWLLYEANLKGNTPAHIGGRLGHLELTKVLVDKAKAQEVKMERRLLRMLNLSDDMALHEAVRSGHYEVAKFLVEEDGELIRFINGARESPLFLAVDRGFYEIALLILRTAPNCSYNGMNGM